MTSSVVSHLANIRRKQPWFVINSAQSFSFSSSQDQHISHFYSFEANDLAEYTPAIPDGCVDILFDCDTNNPSVAVYGTPLEAVNMQLKPKHKYFGVRFASAVMPDFLDLSAGEVINHKFDLLDVCENTEQWLEAIVNEPVFSNQVSLFKQFIQNKSARQRPHILSEAIAYIHIHKGNIKIPELIDITGASGRTLQRQFTDNLGMSAKAYSRIVRCQSAIYDINHKVNLSFSQLAFDLGFADHPHFLREFKKLVSTTPLLYQYQVKQKSYLERIRYV